MVLIILVNNLKTEHLEISLQERNIMTAQIRLRPIVLTSITTVAGLLPMAYGIYGSAPFSEPVDLAIGYEILFATPITLIFVPCLPAAMNDIHKIPINTKRQ